MPRLNPYSLVVLGQINLLPDEPGEFIPTRYRPQTTSAELTGDFGILVLALSVEKIPLHRIWAAPKDGGILIPLLENQRAFSSAHPTTYLRPEIVKRAIELHAPSRIGLCDIHFQEFAGNNALSHEGGHDPDPFPHGNDTNQLPQKGGDDDLQRAVTWWLNGIYTFAGAVWAWRANLHRVL